MRSLFTCLKPTRITICVLGLTVFLSLLIYNIVGDAFYKEQDGDMGGNTKCSQSLVAHLRRSNQETSSRHLEKSIASLNARQNRLEEYIARLEDQLYGDSTASELDKGANLADEKTARVTEAYYEEQVTLLDETLDDENADASWSMRAVEEINTSLSNSGVLRSFNSRCQSTMCRIDMEFVDQYRSGEDFRFLSENLPWNGMMFFKSYDEGRQGTMYLAREGHDLPRLEM